MLRGLPLSSVKIDRTLIDPMPAPDAGCQVLQGFLYARPLEPAEAVRWMRGRPEFKN